VSVGSRRIGPRVRLRLRLRLSQLICVRPFPPQSTHLRPGRPGRPSVPNSLSLTPITPTPMVLIPHHMLTIQSPHPAGHQPSDSPSTYDHYQ
jgi:hypothetical protein